jgi:anti-sigma B factor antagonist
VTLRCLDAPAGWERMASAALTAALKRLNPVAVGSASGLVGCGYHAKATSPMARARCGHAAMCIQAAVAVLLWVRPASLAGLCAQGSLVFDDRVAERNTVAVSGLYEPGEVEIAMEDGLSIVRLLGDQDLSTQQLIATRLAALIESGDPLVFDLTDATFVDSTFVKVVMTAADELARRGVPIALVVPDDAATVVSRLIEVVGFAGIPIVRSRDEAKLKLLPSSESG